MAKYGPKSWFAKLPGELRRRVNDALDSGADSTAAIYRQRNLRRFVSARTFREYAAQRAEKRNRAEHETHELPHRVCESTGAAAGRTSPAATAPCDTTGGMPVQGYDADAILEETMRAMLDALARGEVKNYVLPGYVAAVAKLREVSIKEAAEKRAEELHAAKTRELRAALEQASNGGIKSLEYRDVVDLVDKIMRGEAA